MAGVLPSGLPSFAAYTDIDRTSDDLLVYDASAQQLKTRPAGDLYNSIAENTVQVNSVDDLPAAVAGVRTLLESTRYIINNVIDLGTDSLVMQNGTAIEGWAAQRCEITSAGSITIDTAPTGGFNTCILEGPLRIRNTNAAGTAVNVQQGVFLIQEGINIVGGGGTSAGVRVTSAGAAALFVTRLSASAVANAMLIEGALSFGAIIDDFNSTSLTGNSINFNGTAGVTNFGTISINNANSSSAGVGFRFVGLSSSIIMSGCRFASTADSGMYVQSTSGGRISNMNLVNTSITGAGTSKHGLDISSGFFGSLTVSSCLISSTAGGTSYAVNGQVPASSPFSTSAAFAATTMSGTTGIFGGMTKADSKVSVKACAGIADSVVAGSISISSAQSDAATTSFVEIGSAGISGAATLSNSERTSLSTSATTYRLKVTAPNPGNGTLYYAISYTQGTASTVISSFRAVQYRSGVGTPIAGTTTAFSLSTATTESGSVSMAVPVSYQENDEFYIEFKAASAMTLTFTTLTLSLGS
jgi:hypothetical protein